MGTQEIDYFELNDDPDRQIDEEIAERLMTTRGRALTVDEINSAIEDILGTDEHLRAVERDGHILLEDGVNEPADGDDLSRNELVLLCYEWEVFVGYTSNNLAEWID